MFNFMEQRYYTPQEIASMSANNERTTLQAAINNQNLMNGMNIAQNLGANGSLGFLLGTAGSSLLKNYLQRGAQKKIDKAQAGYYSNLLNQQGENFINNTFGARNQQLQSPPPMAKPASDLLNLATSYNPQTPKYNSNSFNQNGWVNTPFSQNVQYGAW